MRAAKALLTAGLLIAIFCGSYAARRQGRNWNRPQIQVPRAVDLGAVERGTWIVAPLVIKNSGGKALEITNVSTSCGCMALGPATEGQEQSLKQTTVAPGATLELAIRTSVRGELGAQFVNFVQFDTNDPDHPRVRIEVTAAVLGGATPVPAKLALVGIPRDGILRRKIEVRDLRSPHRALRQVTTDHPEIVELSWAGENKPADATNPELGTLIGVVDLAIHAPKQPGPFTASVQVYLDDSSSEMLIPIDGSVAAAVTLTPPIVVLPQRRRGKLEFFARVECRASSNEEAIIEIIADTLPNGVSIEQGSSTGLDPMAVKELTVKWDQAKRNVNSPMSFVIPLRIKLRSQDEKMELEVYCRPPEP
jgi:hypothetical protein